MQLPVKLTKCVQCCCKVEMQDRSCQAPEDLSCNHLATAKQLPSSQLAAARLDVQDARLTAFLDWACPAMLRVLSTASGLPPDTNMRITSSATTAVSAGYACLAFEALLSGRKVVAIAYPAAASTTHTRICAAYCSVIFTSPEAELKDHTINSKGVLCVWDLLRHESPSAVLVSEGKPTCCCWGVGSCSNMVVAGNCWRLSSGLGNGHTLGWQT